MIVDDQARLRANLKEMPATAAAYKRYLEKFDQQETQIEDLPEGDQAAAGHRVLAEEGVRGLPRQSQRRIRTFEIIGIVFSRETAASVRPALAAVSRLNRFPVVLPISRHGGYPDHSPFWVDPLVEELGNERS